MLPNSIIAQSFVLGTGKIRYAAYFRTASYLRSLFEDEVNKSSRFVPWFDESLNSQSQTCDTDLIIQHFTETKKIVLI